MAARESACHEGPASGRLNGAPTGGVTTLTLATQPPGLVAIHGGVGAVQQCIVILAVRGIQGQADGSGDVNLHAVDRIALANVLADLFRNIAGNRCVVEVREKRNEFVPAVATGEVLGPDTGRDSRSDGRQQSVSDRVPVSIIHDLEAVEIDE